MPAARHEGPGSRILEKQDPHKEEAALGECHRSRERGKQRQGPVDFISTSKHNSSAAKQRGDGLSVAPVEECIMKWFELLFYAFPEIAVGVLQLCKLLLWCCAARSPSSAAVLSTMAVTPGAGGAGKEDSSKPKGEHVVACCWVF